MLATAVALRPTVQVDVFTRLSRWQKFFIDPTRGSENHGAAPNVENERSPRFSTKIWSVITSHYTNASN
jgi:hypothetical protein